MALLSDERIDEVLRAHNPWWVSGALPPRARHTHPRRIDRELSASERPVLLLGPRRSGKTAALERQIGAHLRAGKRPQDVAYLPLDHPLLRLSPLGPLVDRALRHMQSDGRPLVLLDGLQTLPEWPERFQEVVQTRPQPRLVGAAATSPGVVDPACDTLFLPPFSFPEFCELRGLPDLDAPPLDLFDPRLPEVADAADDYLFDRVLDPLLADYLVRGGVPEAILEPDPAVGQRRVRENVVARAVYQDLPSVVGVLKLADLERVLIAALALNGAPVVLESFADSLELDKGTVARYLEHLGRAYLLNGLRNFAASTERSRPRYYPLDPALPNALLERGAAVLARPVERHALLVGAIVAQVTQAAERRGFDVAYYRDGDVEAEVVVVSPEGAVPIVVVDREEVGEEEAALVERLLKKTQSTRAFLLSRAGPRRRAAVTFFESVYHVPAAYFLYALQR